MRVRVPARAKLPLLDVGVACLENLRVETSGSSAYMQIYQLLKREAIVPLLYKHYFLCFYFFAHLKIFKINNFKKIYRTFVSFHKFSVHIRR